MTGLPRRQSELPGEVESRLNPAWYSLVTSHADLAVGRGAARSYPSDVSPFAGLLDDSDERAWIDLAAAAEPNSVIVLIGSGAEASGGLHPRLGANRAPAGWQYIGGTRGVQLVDDGVQAEPDEEAVRLSSADVPEMLRLTELTKPGPFLPRTIELGTYFGIWRDDRLVAMAGQRLRPPGFTEISTVCTDPDYRKQGLAARLVLAVAADIRVRDETPIMHAAADNVNAIRLYESLGFLRAAEVEFSAYRVPG